MAGTTLPDKLLALAPGERMILPDPKRQLDRAIVTLRQRSRRLDDIQFTVRRVRYIDGDRLMPAIMIERQ